DFDTLAALGDEARIHLSQARNVTYTSASLNVGAPVASVQADEAMARLSGRQLDGLAALVRADLDGVVGGSVLEGVEELPVRVILDDAARSSFDAVRGKALPGAAGSGGLGAPISALGEIALEPRVAVITREDGERTNRIYGHIQPFTLPDVANRDFQSRLAEAGFADALPTGYRIEVGGEAAERGDAIGGLFSTAIPLLILMVGAIVLAFNSFSYAGVIGLVGLQSVGLAMLGGLVYALPRIWLEPAGIKNNGIFHSSAQNRGWIGIGVGVFLIGFYVVLYFHPAVIADWIRLGDPLSKLMRGTLADQWFFYGMLYTAAVLTMGVRMAVNYRHSRYQLVRTASVSFFQLGFAFLIPALMVLINKPELGYDLKNAWPLDYSAFFDYRIDGYKQHGAFGWVMLFWTIALSTLVVPALAFFFGKRWYCSWVCGCGGLAETLGDPYRHLSDKSLKAWRIERWLIHGVLVFAVVMTGIVVWDLFTESAVSVAGFQAWQVRSWYGFAIGSVFAGVVGTGFYPLMGNRVWCRFGCPLAAILGMVQKFKSRFRITTNGGQCISCGNCSTYCEQGIDVRWYAQRGQNIIRSSCVGCGICSQVCPRGVLRLENGPTDDRYNEVSLVQIGKGRIDIG
ncbi:MAG: efflux RND transporter permease subunit, partial [Acidobacteriota bacterium]